MVDNTGGNDDAESDGVPMEFPHPCGFATVSGSQPKLLLTRYGGRFFSPGGTPPERADRWRLCETIAEQLHVKSLESKMGKRSHMTELEILQQYLVRLIATGWVSAPEARWTIRRCAELLGGWPIPPDAKEPPAGNAQG